MMKTTRIPLRFIAFLLATGSTFLVYSLSLPVPQTSGDGRKLFPDQQPVGNILIVDHLNINHEKGRHDWLKAFYFDFLKCVPDPRKIENLEKGRKTLWANIGAQQFHLPEGKPDAQVLSGVVTLVYPDLARIQDRLDEAKEALAGSRFQVAEQQDDDLTYLSVTDPWGSQFRLVLGDEDSDRDARGEQDGGRSEGLAMRDITFYTGKHSNIAGIGRFYEQVLGAPLLESSDDRCVVSVGPKQTLTFCPHPEGLSQVTHEDLQDDHVEPPEGFPSFLSNYGPHVSLYVLDLPASYRRANALGLAYVNPRFKRRAYTLDEAVDDCMFRCLEIVDPNDVEAGPILRLEHEVRSVVKRNGSKYKSCPFDEIPDNCRTL